MKPNDKSLDNYFKKPNNDNALAVIRAHQPHIDGIVHNLLGDRASGIARRRAYIMAVQALKKYRPESGVPFDKYLGSQLQAVRRMGRQIHEPISIPERHRRYQAMLAQAREELVDELDREPSQQELADKTGLSMRQLTKTQGADRNVMPVGGWLRATASEDNPGGSLPAMDEDPAREWQDYVYHDMDDIDKQIFDARQAGAMSNRDMAAKLNLSPGAISQRASRIEARIARGPF